jgi:isocitrate dehydrogenase
MNVVIVRENEEDLYGGIEHQQTFDVVQCLKLISRPGCERIIRYAFEYAKQNNRKKVTCFTKDNIMKLTDGLFHRVFDEIRTQYPDIQSDHMIIDIATAKLANNPEIFDVIVTPNLYGDIISDVAAEITGSVGLGSSANIGDNYAMFEAIHGSAPDIAGKNIANPSGLLLAAVMMLVHLHQNKTAAFIHNAWLKTIEDGEHTGDIYSEKLSHHRLGTDGFANAVISRLGQNPKQFQIIQYREGEQSLQEHLQENATCSIKKKTEKRELVGVDIFVFWPRGSAQELAEQVHRLATPPMQLNSICNRGTKVWPQGHPETFCSDHWRCRFESTQGKINHAMIVDLLTAFTQSSVEFIKIENLYQFNGKPGYTKMQGD